MRKNPNAEIYFSETSFYGDVFMTKGGNSTIISEKLLNMLFELIDGSISLKSALKAMDKEDESIKYNEKVINNNETVIEEKSKEIFNVFKNKDFNLKELLIISKNIQY